MGVSKNRGTTKSSILIGFSIINHPFWGTPILGNTYIYIYLYPHWAHSIPLNSGLHAHSLNHLLRPWEVAPKKARWVWEAVVWNTVVRCLFQGYGCQPKNNGKFMETPPKSSHFVHRVGFPWNFHHPFWGVFPPIFGNTHILFIT